MSETVKRCLADMENALNYATAMPKTWREAAIEVGGLLLSILIGVAWACLQ